MDAALPQPRILIVEDDEAIGDAMEFHLAHAGMRTNLVSDGLAGMRALSADVPDVLILDLMLPHLDGWHLIRRVREWAPQLPIIVVTARTNEHDRVEVLGLGADDVMAKPFSMRELTARVSAALRRAAAASPDQERAPIIEGDLRIDPERFTADVAGRPADLTPMEFRLLLTLAEERARALSRDEIYRKVWGGERGHGDRSVDVLVRRLRRKVDEVGGEYTYVQTAHRVGYRLAAVPRRMPDVVRAQTLSSF
jgi:DNA-binding response OmpR family regulator